MNLPLMFKKLILTLKIIIFCLLLQLRNSQICGKKNPSQTSDCSYSSYDDQACCYINYNGTIRGCLFVPQNSTFITPYITSLNFGLDELFSIKIDCGKNEEEKENRLCGSNPKEEDDCFFKSNSTYDCCFFQTPVNEKFCLWNPVKLRKNSNIFGINITCFKADLKGFFLVESNLILLLFSLFVIFIA